MKEINNNIQESYCSIEVSKLLKEKGCNLNTEKVFLEGFIIPFWKDGLCSIVCEYISHTLAIEWLRVNFGIWIFAIPFDDHDWIGRIIKIDEIYEYDQLVHSPQEAIEAALLHTLTKLI